MSEEKHCAFPLVDRFHGIRMGLDLADVSPGVVTVVETARRLRKEQSYGYVHALWWLWLEDGRSAVSVPPGAGDDVRRVISTVRTREAFEDPELAGLLRKPVDTALRAAGLEDVDRVIHDLVFACNAALLRRHRHGDCRRFINDSVPAAEGLRMPKHCFPDGIVYGVVEDDQVVSVASAHRTGVMEDRVADLGIGTAEAYRRRGYAQTAVSAVVEEITDKSGEARYGCSPDNAASIATARSVGFVPYAVSLTLSAPSPEKER